MGSGGFTGHGYGTLIFLEDGERRGVEMRGQHVIEDLLGCGEIIQVFSFYLSN